MADLRTARRTAGQAPRVFEDGAQRRDFVSVHDVAAANVLALRHPEPAAFRAYNVASGAVRTVGQMATELAAAWGTGAGGHRAVPAGRCPACHRRSEPGLLGAGLRSRGAVRRRTRAP